jgi:riboflavin synthase
MFTGLITDVGEVIDKSDGKFTLRTAYKLRTEDTGLSICCDGVCLTATAIKPLSSGAEFSVDVSNETLAKSTLSNWAPGSRVNLERSLKVGDELGGHLVAGHVDGLARVLAREDMTDMARFTLRAPHDLARFIAAKGSAALDGVSLTVNAVAGDDFTVLIIPHTLKVTTLGALQAGDDVNLEIDTMARYAARLLESRE